MARKLYNESASNKMLSNNHPNLPQTKTLIIPPRQSVTVSDTEFARLKKPIPKDIRVTYVHEGVTEDLLSYITTRDSVPSKGGNVNEIIEIPSLKASDKILSVCQRTPGWNEAAMIGFGGQDDGELEVMFDKDPGAGAIIRVAVLKNG